ncbi:MAG: glycosyltransferase family 4 protein [Candidatus Helarchaeota archaeon]|nr:glycosyltransferase family 4 protein [Candidatus Helarchaeota archaeon]
MSKHMVAYFNAISDIGVDVNLYCLGSENKKAKFSILKVPVKSILDGATFAPLFNSIAFSHEFAKLIDDEEYDILHCFNTTTLFLKERKYLFQTSNPTYAFALDAVKDEYPKTVKYQRLLKYYALVAELERLEYDQTDIIIANSDVVKENIVNYYGVDSSQIEIIPNGVRPEECNFNRPLQSTGKMKIVLFPSTIHVMKGFRYLVEAMAEIRKTFPETILIVCGRIHPFEYDMFKNLIERKRKESGIVLAGFMPREQLSKYYHMADVCVMPLLFGTMSTALLEAIAHGLPIVTTSHSGIPNVEDVGIKVPAKDSNAIADAIIKLLSNPNLWKKKSENTRRVIKNYLWSDIAKKSVEIYERLI